MVFTELKSCLRTNIRYTYCGSTVTAHIVIIPDLCPNQFCCVSLDIHLNDHTQATAKASETEECPRTSLTKTQFQPKEEHAFGVTFCFPCLRRVYILFVKKKRGSLVQLAQVEKSPERTWIKCLFSSCFDKSSADTSLRATTWPLVCPCISDITSHPILSLNY